MVVSGSVGVLVVYAAILNRIDLRLPEMVCGKVVRQVQVGQAKKLVVVKGALVEAVRAQTEQVAQAESDQVPPLRHVGAEAAIKNVVGAIAPLMEETAA